MNETHPPDDTRIIVRITQVPELDAPLPQDMIDKLIASERIRIEKFTKRADQWRFVIGRLLIAHVLLVEFGLSNWDLQFSAHGRPELYVKGLRSRLDVNIAHAGNLVVCAVVADGWVGIDVEPLASFNIASEIVPHYLHLTERPIFEDAGLSQKPIVAALYWVMKEAILKCRGTGLSVDPRSLRIDLPELKGQWYPHAGRAEHIAYHIEGGAYIGLAVSSPKAKGSTIRCDLEKVPLANMHIEH